MDRFVSGEHDVEATLRREGYLPQPAGAAPIETKP
jgi:hypothetical protein